jgi:hydroxymethylbilane synthase
MRTHRTGHRTRTRIERRFTGPHCLRARSPHDDGGATISGNGHIVLGSRGSGLALAQAGQVKHLLGDRHPGLAIDIRVIATEGDIDRISPLSGFGGRGAFVRSIETALLCGEIDVGVHSLKDLPSRLPEGLVLGAAPLREDPRDALIAREGLPLDRIPQGGTVATGSDRRRIQLAALRPDIVFRPVRGNIETRVRKPGNEGIDAVVLAAAGLMRLGMESLISRYFTPEEMLPAPCQGAIGLECRAGDTRTLGLLRAVENDGVRVCVDTEREFIAVLGLGCHAPVAALAVIEGGDVRFEGFAANGAGASLRTSFAVPRERAFESARETALKLKRELGI